MIHYSTKNTSFLKMYYILKNLGVKNNTFFLKLNDSSLEGIDPHDEENLTIDQKIRIFIECKNNFWYFIREVLRVPGSGGKTFFEIHRGNLALYVCLLLNINILMLTPRQIGKTTGVMAFYLWGIHFGFTNVNIGMFTLSEKLSQDNIRKLKELRELLPNYLKIKGKKDIANASTYQVSTDGNTNRISTKAVGTTEEAAGNSARGFSFPMLYYDEFAFIEQIETHYNTAIFSYATAAKIAEKNNSYRHIAMTTTAGDLMTKCGQWGYNLLSSAAPFSERIYDMTIINEDGEEEFDKRAIADYVINQSVNSKSINTAFVKLEFEYFELGKGDEYIEEQREFFKGSSSDKFEREVLLKWLRGNSDHPLGYERIAKLRDNVIKPKQIDVIDNIYFLNLYRSIIDKNVKYIIGVDCSANTKNDFSTFVAVDPTNFEVVATMRVNQFSINRFAKTIVYLMNTYFPKSIVLIERNGVGAGVVDYVNTKLPPNRVFHDDKDNPGITATKALRDLLYSDVLKQSVINNSNKIHDKNIVDEIFTLEYTKQGRVDHMPGCHDDMLMAYLYTMYFLTHCKTKSKYIDPIYIGIYNNQLNYYEDKENDISKLDMEVSMRNSDIIKTVQDIQNQRKGIEKSENSIKYLNNGFSSKDIIAKQNQDFIKNIKTEKAFNYNPNDKISVIRTIHEVYDDDFVKELSEIKSRTIKQKNFDDRDVADRVDELVIKDTQEIESEMQQEAMVEQQNEFLKKMAFRNSQNRPNNILNRFLKK